MFIPWLANYKLSLIFKLLGSYGEVGAQSSTSRGKKRTLEELFKPPLHLMFKGDWQSVRDAATAAKKWLIVNIQVWTQRFVLDTEKIQDIFN